MIFSFYMVVYKVMGVPLYRWMVDCYGKSYQWMIQWMITGGTPIIVGHSKIIQAKVRGQRRCCLSKGGWNGALKTFAVLFEALGIFVKFLKVESFCIGHIAHLYQTQ